MSEYKPTEYIVDFGDSRSNRFVRLNMALIEQNSARLQERIVRCRDCKHCVRYETWNPEGEAFNCNYWGSGTEPDGFCAWGERRPE